MIIISHPTKSVVVRYRPDIGQLFPHGIRFEWRGNDLIKLPHGIEETRLLRNLGLTQVPAPILEHYDFPSADGKKAFDKQVLTSASMTMHSRSYVLNDMGTGKTRAAIWAHDYLRSIGLANRMLVVAPLSTLNFTWEKEIMMTLPFRKVKVLTGTAAKRHKLLEEDADIYIVNHDGLRVIHKALMSRPDIDTICFDEAAAYRNARAERSKVARSIARTRRYVWGMTGSPTPTDPTDAYGLAHLITPMTAPKSWVQFRADTMLNVSQFKWVAKTSAKDTVAQVLQPAVRYRLDDITELPEVVERDVEVALGRRQEQALAVLKEHAAAMFKDGTVTAVNGGVLFSKMLQAALGWIYGDDDKLIALDNKNRLDALVDLINANERKVLVFSLFKSATKGISERLKQEGIDFAEITGDVPQKERTEIFTAFQGTDKYHVINAHPETMSHGLTLTAADTIIWFGPITKLETYEQANARIRRVGQAHRQQVIRMVAAPLERMLYRRLDAKADLQESVLDILAGFTKGD